MGAISARSPHLNDFSFCKRRGARLGVTLFVLCTAAFATAFVSAASAASLPSLIAYLGRGGIGVVHPGHVHSARLFYAPASGGTASPAWSPNGETMAAGVNTPRGLGIVVVNRSGRVIDAVELPYLEGPSDLGAWSPDGKQIAYLCLDPPVLTTPSSSPFVPANRFFNVCVLDVVTGAHRLLAVSTLSEGLPLTGSIISSNERISWSRARDEIAVGGERDIASSGDCVGFACGQPDIGLVDVATGTLTALDGTDNYADPAFSPNGSEIAFTTVPKGGVDIMSASGGDVRGVVSPSSSSGNPEPNWSPDAKQLAFEGNDDLLFTVDVHGGAPKEATDGIAGDPSWVAAITRCTVPKLKGQTLAAAKRLVALAGCVVGKVTGRKKNRSKLHVVDQKPAANRDVAVGTKVNVQIR